MEILCGFRESDLSQKGFFSFEYKRQKPLGSPTALWTRPLWQRWLGIGLVQNTPGEPGWLPKKNPRSYRPGRLQRNRRENQFSELVGRVLTFRPGSDRRIRGHW